MVRHCAAMLVTAAAALGGCGGGDDPPATGATGAGLPTGSEPVTLDPDRFSARIDNRHWPMTPGTRWTYRESDGKGAVQKVIVTATSQTRRIANGITARIVRDSVTEDGRLIEDTLDWYAQDDDGNVWYLGEDTAEFENGRVTTRAGSFEAGVDGALPGIAMPGAPRAGLAYRQEYYKGEAEDNGKILSVDELAQVPHGTFKDVVLTKDTITIEPDVLEYKLYAPGVGPVLILSVSGGGGGREELVKVQRVGPRAAKAAATAPLGKRYP